MSGHQMQTLLLSVEFLATSLLAQTPPPSAEPLIPLKVLLSPPSIQAVEISPNGKTISFIAPLDGVPNLFVAPAASPGSRRPVTKFKGRGIQSFDVSGNVIYRW